jgi:hypothetical protein
MLTRKPIQYWMQNKYVTIPAGTRCDLAANLPQPQEKNNQLYFSRGWRGMSKEARNFGKNVGFLLTRDQILGN